MSTQLTPAQQRSLAGKTPAQRRALLARYAAQNSSNGNTRNNARLVPARRNNALPVRVPRLTNTAFVRWGTPAMTTTFHFVQSPQFQPLHNRNHTLTLRLHPIDNGMAHYRPVFARWIYTNVSYRFVGTIPDNKPGNFYAGFSASIRVIPNQPNAVMGLPHAVSGRSNLATPWINLGLTTEAVAMPYEFSAADAAASMSNTLGYLHLLLVGATPHRDADNHGTHHGFFEIRGTVKYFQPIGAV
jgi:hypothetical protein